MAYSGINHTICLWLHELTAAQFCINCTGEIKHHPWLFPPHKISSPGVTRGCPREVAFRSNNRYKSLHLLKSNHLLSIFQFYNYREIYKHPHEDVVR
ncbi:hypothetical protein SAMN05444266_10177 [Chitinophaga jiangningensis]|uniref:Uncharacterized protein n=1 Tax=Chitinophaga jiangningensis TaxID=1419482 RepID=A0A1M6V613_9BACT|nr:hypothetical protein SAMN05444266_10177 [Chitinophaga jiangningensis]